MRTDFAAAEWLYIFSKTMTSCAILQSNYIPWKGYFDLINTVDEFVLFDCVQYTRRDWRNRNKIKTPRDTVWLTIPVQSKGNYEAPIDTILIDDANWAERHWQTIATNYSKASCFSEYGKIFQESYESIAKLPKLSQVNEVLIRKVCECLGIKTRITDSRSYLIAEEKTERLLSITKQVGANIYYSGPAAQSYFDNQKAAEENIEVRWMNYAGYPEYSQLFPPFQHSVSILDLLFNTGADAHLYMNSFQQSAKQV
jgi:hypothetical protein